jgi:acetoin utilization protein AcuB
MMKAKDIMTRKVITISPRNSLKEAIGEMQKNNIRRMPVLEGNNLVGMLVQHDIEKALRTPGVVPETPVDWVMTKHNLMKVNSDDEVLKVAQIMRDHKLSALPVIEEDQLVGIITDSDILSLFIHMLAEKY